MLLHAQEEISIDIRSTMMIGEKISDIIQLPDLETLLINQNNDLKNTPAVSKIHSLATEDPFKF